MRPTNRRLSRAALVVAVLLAAVAARDANAGAGVWTTGGPDGVEVQALWIDPGTPSTIHAATYGAGVLNSTDAGVSWTRGPEDGFDQTLPALVGDPSTPGVLYAGSLNGSVFKSTDGGLSWFAVNNGFVGALYSRSAMALAVDPLASSTVYVGFTGTGGGVFKSTNAAGLWAPASSGLPAGGDVQALALSPGSSSTLYAGVGDVDAGIYKSTDGGGSWVKTSTGLPASTSISALCVDPLNPATLYAGGASVYKSTNAGASWLPGASIGGWIRALVPDPSTPGTIYAATDGGVFKSTNSGGTWGVASAGLVGLATRAVAVNPATPATLYSGTNGGIFKSTNAAGNWTDLSAGIEYLSVLALARDSSGGGTLYAGTRARGILKSTNDGATWTPSGTGLSEGEVRALALDPNTPATLYAATGNGVYKSTDAGGVWAHVGTVDMYLAGSLLVESTSPTTLYAGAYQGVFKSTDAGANWVELAAGLPPAPFCWSMAADPATPTTLFLGTVGNGIYRSTNSGTSWAAASAGIPPGGFIWSLAVGLQASHPVYAATLDGLFRSTDSGTTWSLAMAGLPHHFVGAITADPVTPGTLYTGMFGGGVFKSTDGGDTWAAINAGLALTHSTNMLLVDRTSGTRLYAGMNERGAWQTTPPPPAFLKGDFDGDGARDLVFRSNVDGRRNKLWLMNGAVRAGETDVAPDAASADWKVRGVDDFDNDGKNDLVFWNQATGNVEFWIMNGATRVGAPVPLSGGPVLDPGWDLAATADMDGDSRPDLVWRNATSQNIVIWTMNGTKRIGARTPTPSQAVDGNWQIVAALDYNNDATRDFLWYNATSGKLVTWYLDGDFVRISGQFTTPSAAGDNNWRVLASSDYSGTSVPATPPLGSPDIVWRNETSGNQVVWHMDFASTRVFGQFTTPSANSPALDWTIVGPR